MLQCSNLIIVGVGLYCSVLVGVLQTRVGHFERQFQTEGGVAHQPLLVIENI